MQAALWKSLENQKDFPWLEIIGNSITFASWISPNILLHIPQLNSFLCLHAGSFVKVFRKSKVADFCWPNSFNRDCGILRWNPVPFPIPSRTKIPSRSRFFRDPGWGLPETCPKLAPNWRPILSEAVVLVATFCNACVLKALAPMTES